MPSPEHVTTAFSVPRGACDCHTHVFLDRSNYPFARDRKYTPPPATIEQLDGLMKTLRLERVVVVQPSVYGADNSATLACIEALGLRRARGVAVVDENVTLAELDRLTDRGVRGIRLNFETRGEDDAERAARHLKTMAARIAGHGWHIQIYAQLPLIHSLQDAIAALPVPVVLDHFAGARAELGLEQPGLAGLLDLVRSGSVYIKLSSSYRVSRQALPYSDVDSIARAFVAANPDRMLWGSDWPHPDPSRRPEDISPPLPIDDVSVFALLAGWTGDEDVYRKILSDNPAALYDFERT